MLSNIKEIFSGNEMKKLAGELAEQLRQATAAVKEQTELIAGLKKESWEAKARVFEHCALEEPAAAMACT